MIISQQVCVIGEPGGSVGKESYNAGDSGYVILGGKNMKKGMFPFQCS